MSAIIVAKPVSFLNRNVKFSLKDFFVQSSSAVAGTALQASLSDSVGVLTGLIRGITGISKTVSLEETDVFGKAWLLLVGSLAHALTTILQDFDDLFVSTIDDNKIKSISEALKNKINQLEITLAEDFFTNPQNQPFLNDLTPLLIEWLQQLGLNEQQANSFINQFKIQFAISLDRQWAQDPTVYTPIFETINTPFSNANKRQRQLIQYRLWLQQQVNERIFDEDFGLKQIYIPLRAYYYMKGEAQDITNEPPIETEVDIEQPIFFKNNKIKKVCQIHDEIDRWLNSNEREDSLRVISGGPGSGKSSFGKILASDLAERHHPVLFIPLHRFRIDNYLPDAIKSFLSNYSILSAEHFDEEENLLLIFDGLDELSMQGKNVKEVANDFTEALQGMLRYKKALKWKAIITGRDLAIQQQRSKLRKEKTVLHLLPYFIDEEERQDFDDVDNLLSIDQRNEWWHKLSALKGLDFDGLPKNLATKHLQPITTEPLLNYLVSLSYLKPNGIKFTEDTNLNTIYADLLSSVHERKYADGRPHDGINQLDKDEFSEILEEIALTIWHENGRTASIDKIMENCREAGIESYFDEFQGDNQTGIVRLLMAFYFREFDGKHTDKTFEFTHKSFGEYLTARRIIAELEVMREGMALRREKKRGKGLKAEEAFLKWIKVCGPQRIDGYLGEFLKGEIQILSETEQGKEKIAQYQELIIELVELAVKNKSPVKDLNLNSFEKDLTYIKNSEMALIELHSLCAYQTDKIITDYDYAKGFGSWLLKIHYFIGAKLNHLDLKETYLIGVFISCDFSFSIMSKTEIYLSNFHDSKFISTNLERARLIGVSLNYVDMTDVNLTEVELNSCKFEQAKLIEANFLGANLENANFEGTNHEDAIFTGANLKGTILESIYPSTEEEIEEPK